MVVRIITVDDDVSDPWSLWALLIAVLSNEQEDLKETLNMNILYSLLTMSQCLHMKYNFKL